MVEEQNYYKKKLQEVQKHTELKENAEEKRWRDTTLKVE